MIRTVHSRKLLAPLALALALTPLVTEAQQSTPSTGELGKSTAIGSTLNQQSQTQAGEKPSSGDSDAPSVPGMQARVLKEGEKIPERKNLEYEDWSKPELTPGMRTEAVPLGKSNGDGFVRELVSVQWRDLDPINLWIIRPAGVKSPPVILYLYSYNGSNERYRDQEACKFLVRNGFAAVGFVSAVTDERFHDRARRQTFISELEESLGTTVHDVQMVLNYLAKRGDFDMDRVGMWGDGSGASIAIMAAAVDSRIRAVDLLDPWGDWPDWLAQSSLVSDKDRIEYLKPEFLETVAGLEPLTKLPRLNHISVRLQYIESGVTVTPTIVKQKMEAKAPPNAEIIHYESMKQFITKVVASGTGFDWIKEKVAPSALLKSEMQNGSKATPLTSDVKSR